MKTSSCRYYIQEYAMKKTLIVLFSACLSISVMAQGFQVKENKEFAGLGNYVSQAGFSPFGNFFAYTIGDNTLRLFNADWLKVYEHQGNPESGAGVFAFSPDGEYMAYARYKGETDIAIIRLKDQKVVQVLDRHSSYVYHLEFSHDGNYLSSCGRYNRMIVWKREGESYQFHQEFDQFESYLYESSFSHDDRFLLTGDFYGHVAVYEKQGDRYELFQEFQSRRHNCYAISFHPTEYTFITGSSNGLRRYSFRDGTFVLNDSLEKHTDVRNTMGFSPQGKYLAVPSHSVIKVFELKKDTMELIYTNHRHNESTLYAEFSENGKFLCTSGTDQKVMVWTVNDVLPSDKARVADWLNGELTLAQKRSLSPVVLKEIIQQTKSSLSAPRDEFEKTSEYNLRRAELSDQTLARIQSEMEKIYGTRIKGDIISLKIDNILGYNADAEIYKIRIIDTEAGVKIPVEEAKKLKENWQDAVIQVRRIKKDKLVSHNYEEFTLIHPQSKKKYPVTLLENPFELRLADRGENKKVLLQSGTSVKQDTINGNTYALLFATNVYDFYDDLINPVLDAQTIAAELQENYGVRTEVVLNATLSETAAKLHSFASREYGKKDNLMVFFAGHGIYDEVFREGYVISKDSKSDDLGKTSYLSHSNLRTMINNITCPHIFLVMDVCFGGTFDPHMASAHRGAKSMYTDISTSDFVERKLRYTTRLYLTSGGKEYVPDGRPGFHSPFARRFIESLRFYGGNDGVLTTAEILQFVEKVDPQPRFGEFGDNEPGSDFILLFQ
jgi:WD40 repeat protein